MARKRTQYSEARRKQILAIAVKEGLTAGQVKTTYGVTPVTYYSWRKKYGAGRVRRGRARGGLTGTAVAIGGAMGTLGSLGAQVRDAVQTRVRSMVEDIVRSEVSRHVEELFGASARRRRGPGRPRGRRRGPGRPPKKK